MGRAVAKELVQQLGISPQQGLQDLPRSRRRAGAPIVRAIIHSSLSPMDLPVTCLACRRRSCESTPAGTLDICEYGVTFFHSQDKILRREARVPSRHIASNLRHELNPILALIVEEAQKIDPLISAKTINVDNPASKILAASIIIDNFIQMMTGVIEFQPTDAADIGPRKERRLHDIVLKYFTMYSIVRSANRADNLTLDTSFHPQTIVTYGVEVVEYLFSVLIDNVWKYSLPGSEVRVTVDMGAPGVADVTVQNFSHPISEQLDLFSPGTKADPETKGFGYGLFWATVLIEQYNSRGVSTDYRLELTHRQHVLPNGAAIQSFTLRNLAVRLGE